MATANMVLTLPTVGASTDVWGTELNTALTAIDSHDHTSGNGVQVPAAGLGIDGDVAWGDNSITGIKAARFASQAGSLAAYTLGLVVKANELYWVTSGGAELQLTSSGTINTSILGGVTGDYSTTDAQLVYEDAANWYIFLSDDSPETFAAIGHGDWYHYAQGDDTDDDYIRHRLVAPTVTKTLRWPAGALPASDNSVFTIDSSGQIEWSDTPKVTELRHGDREEVYGIIDARVSGGSVSGGGATASYWTSGGSSQACTIGITLPVGCRIKSFSMWVREHSSNALTLRCYKQTMASSWTMTQVGTDASSSAVGSMTIEKVTHTLGTPETTVTGTKYTLVCVASATSLDCTGFSVTYDWA